MAANIASKIGSTRAFGGLTPHIRTISVLATSARAGWSDTRKGLSISRPWNSRRCRTFAESEKLGHEWQYVIKGRDRVDIMYCLQKPSAHHQANPMNNISSKFKYSERFTCHMWIGMHGLQGYVRLATFQIAWPVQKREIYGKCHVFP